MFASLAAGVVVSTLAWASVTFSSAFLASASACLISGLVTSDLGVAVAPASAGWVASEFSAELVVLFEFVAEVSVVPAGWDEAVVVLVDSSAYTTDGWDAASAEPKTATLAKLVKMIFFLFILKSLS